MRYLLLALALVGPPAFGTDEQWSTVLRRLAFPDAPNAFELQCAGDRPVVPHPFQGRPGGREDMAYYASVRDDLSLRDALAETVRRRNPLNARADALRAEALRAACYFFWHDATQLESLLRFALTDPSREVRVAALDGMRFLPWRRRDHVLAFLKALHRNDEALRSETVDAAIRGFVYLDD